MFLWLATFIQMQYECVLLLQGIACFDLHMEQDLLVTGSKDGKVTFWNPYVTDFPKAEFKHHVRHVVDLKICSKLGIVISVCVEAVSLSHIKCIYYYRKCLQMTVKQIPSKKPFTRMSKIFNIINRMIYMCLNHAIHDIL